MCCNDHGPAKGSSHSCGTGDTTGRDGHCGQCRHDAVVEPPSGLEPLEVQTAEGRRSDADTAVRH
jgi:hypothetical protein